jgi:hypothetical protein
LASWLPESDPMVDPSRKLGLPRARPNRMDWLLVALPFVGVVNFQLVGTLFADEVLLLLMLPLLLHRGWHELQRPLAKAILVAGGAWLVGLMISDYAAATAPDDYLRGWAKVIFFLGSFMAIVMLVQSPRRALLWLTGLTAATFVRPFQLFEADTSFSVLWKFGIGHAVLLACCLPYLWRLLADPEDDGAVRRIALVHLLVGFVSFFFNSRSLAGLAILGGTLLWFYPRYRGRSLRPGLLGLAVGVLGLLAVALAGLYSAGASSGYFGEEAREKYEFQNASGGGVLAILLVGRPEILVSTEAIADSPILGHGSWARDYKYLRLLAAATRDIREDGYDLLAADVNEGLIPTHSYLFGSWVEAGLLGGLFWLVVLYLLVLRVMPVAIRQGGLLAVVTLMLMMPMLWDIFYSPFGAYVRVQVASYLAIFSLLLQAGKRGSARRWRSQP